MPIYKILNVGKQIILSGKERWFSFEEAINELAASSWRLHSFINISVPQPEKFASEDWVATAIMVNDKLSTVEDINRQVKKVEAQIQEKQNLMKLSENDSSIKKTMVKLEIDDLSKLVESLKKSISTKTMG